MNRFRYGKDFYNSLGKLVIPIVIQNLLSAMVNSADVIMLNYVGQEPLAAVSLAAQYANILFMLFYGLGTGATMLCSQYYGKGDLKAVNAVEGIALRFSILLGLLFALCALFIPDRSLPNSATLPLLTAPGDCSPNTPCSTVDLPLPLSPTMHTMSPWFIVKDT